MAAIDFIIFSPKTPSKIPSDYFRIISWNGCLARIFGLVLCSPVKCRRHSSARFGVRISMSKGSRAAMRSQNLCDSKRAGTPVSAMCADRPSNKSCLGSGLCASAAWAITLGSCLFAGKTTPFPTSEADLRVSMRSDAPLGRWYRPGCIEQNAIFLGQ